MDRGIIFESLVVWLETFKLDAPHSSQAELSDGIAMAQVLHQIAPDYFNEAWLGKIKTEDVTNWRLKVSNLKKILKGILEYNIEVLGIQIHDFQMPDVNAIGEHSDQVELGRLLQLILGCAVNCNEKQEYIQRIMAMEESVQHAVMTAIQELMTKEIATDVDSEVGDQLKRTVEELNSAIEAKEELMQRCHELDLQVTTLVEEKQNLVVENEKLAERLNQAENLDDPSTPAGKRFQQLQHQLEQCQEENYKLESAKDDYRIKVDVLQKEINDLQDRNGEFLTMADDYRQLKDELDDVRHTAEQAVKYEAQIESYKKRMDELSDLRGQVKLLEEKNTKYMQENLELQEEVRKSSSLKQQMEVYKRQVLELQTKVTEETKRADKSEFEVKRMNEKVSTFQREKERLLTERDSLREVNEELKCTQLQHVGAGGETLADSTQLEMLSMPPEIKEKLLRLEHENKMLRLKESGDNDEHSQVLQNLLDDANLRKNELETELRLANQKTMELEAQIEDLQEQAKSSVSSSELVELRKKLEEQVQITQQKDKTVQKERETVSDLQTQLTAKSEQFDRLTEELEKKEEEKRQMSDKYKKYFDKARSVISSQEQKLKSTGNYYPDVQALKQQLQEKDKFIEQLKKDQEKSKNTFEQEEKMMVSAWYNLGIQLHRQAAIDRLEKSQGQAFLARQRQMHLRGQQRIPNSHPNSASDLDLSSDLKNGNLGNENNDLDFATFHSMAVRNDGCFASLFDCLLMKLKSEIQLQSDLDRLVVTDNIDATTVHSHLLAGLLGSNLGEAENPLHIMNTNTSADDDYLEPLDECNSSFESKDDVTNQFQDSNDDAKLEMLKSPDKLWTSTSPELVPETPEHRQSLANRSGASVVQHSTNSFGQKCRCNSNSLEPDSNPFQVPDKSFEKLETAPMDVKQTESRMKETIINDILTDVNESIFAELDNYEARYLDEVEELDNEETGLLVQEIAEISKDTSDLQTGMAKLCPQLELSHEHSRMFDVPNYMGFDDHRFFDNVHTQATMQRTESPVLQCLQTDGRDTNTPLKENVASNIPLHLQSPFVSKIPSVNVTKRRSRRRGKVQMTSADDKENLAPGQDCVSTTSRASSELNLCHSYREFLATDGESAGKY